MKKVSTWLLVSSIFLSIAGCSANSDSSKGDTSKTDVAASANQKEGSKNAETDSGTTSDSTKESQSGTTSDSTKTSQSGTKSDSTKSSQTDTKKETKSVPVMFEKKEVKKIEISPANTQDTFSTTNEQNMKAIATSMETAKKATMQLDQKTLDTMTSTMTVTYKDGSKQEYFVWVDAKTTQVSIIKSTKEKQAQGYKLDEEASKKVVSLLKKK
ncbi:hypothetical protein ACFDTO_23475 [Microbacteriaceae bacterium 4G12]